MQELSSVGHTGALIVYKSNEVGSQHVTKMTKEMFDFGDVVAGKEKPRFLELNARFEEILKGYGERGKNI